MSDDFLPTSNVETLKQRAALTQCLRTFFHNHNYWEVETPVVSHDVVVDAHLDPFVVKPYDIAVDDSNSQPSTTTPALFLQTSPEFAMKRLISGGADAIYQIGHAFRVGEQGQLHNPEFTMVEWYCVGETHREQMDFVESMVRYVLTEAGRLSDHQPANKSSLLNQLRNPQEESPVEFERLTYDNAFEKYAGRSVLGQTCEQLNAWIDGQGWQRPQGLVDDDRDGILNWLLAEFVEPHLGKELPTFLYDYPASQAALAKIRCDEPPVAERFELYIAGLEICNGYHELTDANELKRRIDEQQQIRNREGKSMLPAESRLLQAMEHGLPACAGTALGWDRLIMLALGKTDLADVVPFPFPRA